MSDHYSIQGSPNARSIEILLDQAGLSVKVDRSMSYTREYAVPLSGSKESRLILLLDAELSRLLRSPGSPGLSPDARANRFSTSVKLTTPLRRPEMFAPGKAAAGTDAEVLV